MKDFALRLLTALLLLCAALFVIVEICLNHDLVLAMVVPGAFLTALWLIEAHKERQQEESARRRNIGRSIEQHEELQIWWNN